MSGLREEAEMSDKYDRLFDSIRPGQKWRRFFHENHPSNRLYHIRGKVDDYIVVRYWHRFRWNYRLLDIWFFVSGIQSGSLTKVD